MVQEKPKMPSDAEVNKALFPWELEEPERTATVWELADRYFETCTSLSLRTRNNNRKLSETWIKPFFFNVHADRITMEMLAEWLGWIEANLGPRSVKNTVNLLKKILGTGVGHCGLKANPAEGLNVSWPVDSGWDKNAKAWTSGEFKTFIKNVKDPHFHLFFNILFCTGLWVGEITALHYSDINAETGEVAVTKTLQKIKDTGILQEVCDGKRNRTVFLEDSVLEEYCMYLKTVKRKRGWKDRRVFNRTPAVYRGVLDRTCRGIGMEPITFNGFRASAAKELFRMGFPVEYISEWLGNSGIQSTLKMICCNGLNISDRRE